MNSIRFSLVVLAILFVGEIFGHSYVSSPATRGRQGETNNGCRGPSCLGPCEPRSNSPAATPVQRGASLDIRWPRNNHAGGFVRFAWARTTATTNAEFDAGASIYECYEKGPACEPASASDPNGGDSASSTQTGCQSIITVPNWLDDGAWTLQWAWFGGAFSLGDYFSCIDYVVSGGPTSSQPQPVFRGGDYANPGKPVCKFFNTDELHKCISEPCTSPTLPGQNVGTPRNIALAASGSDAGAGSDTTDVSAPCTSNADCPSGVCQLSGFCYKKSSKLGAGGIAAIVFAMIFVAVVALAVLFVFLNKTEVRNWKPFKK